MMDLCEIVDKFVEEIDVENVEDRKASIQRQLFDLRSCDAIEEGARAELKGRLISLTYPKISMRFLRHSDSVEIQGRRLNLPHFGVFCLGEASFGIKTRWRNRTAGAFKREKRVSFLPRISRAFGDLAYAIDPSASWIYEQYSAPITWHSDETYYPWQLGDAYPARSNYLEMMYEISMIVPPATKKKMKEAERHFENNLYIVTELDPTKWQSKVIPIGDPLVIGIWQDREAYLVAKFDPTPLEDYVTREFSVDEEGGE